MIGAFVKPKASLPRQTRRAANPVSSAPGGMTEAEGNIYREIYNILEEGVSFPDSKGYFGTHQEGITVEAFQRGGKLWVVRAAELGKFQEVLTGIEETDCY